MSHPNFVHLSGRAKLACIMLIIGIIADSGAFLLELMCAGMGIDTNADEPSSQALFFIFAMAGVGIIQLIMMITTAVFFLRWMHLAYSNLHSQQIPGLRATPKMAMWWWFIPLMNMFRPFQIMKEIWQASDPSSTAENWKSIKPPWMFGTWWGFWLFQGILGQAAFKLTLKGGPDTNSLAEVLTAGSDITSLVAGLLLLSIVTKITQNQDLKFAGAESAVSNNEPR